MPSIVLLAAFLIGSGFGVVAARSHFCTMGALSDYFLFGSRRRLRGLAMATAVALAGTSLLALSAIRPMPSPTGIPWFSSILGGLCFGIGMTLAGGCITRNLVRTGSGSLRAGVTILVASLVAAIAMAALPHFSAALPAAGLASLPSLPPWSAWVGLVLAVGAAAWCLFPAKERVRSKGDLLAGAALGLSVPLWHLLVGGHPSVIQPAFLLPAADLLRLPFTGDAGMGAAGAALLLGVIAGAAGTAIAGRTARLEAFVDRADVGRHMAGAVLMGAGGALAGSCSFGLIVSGIGALLPAAFIGTIALVIGCRQSLRVLEGRSFWSW